MFIWITIKLLKLLIKDRFNLYHIVLFFMFSETVKSSKKSKVIVTA